MIASPALPPIARPPKRICGTPSRAARMPNRTGSNGTECSEPGGGALPARLEEPAIPHPGGIAARLRIGHMPTRNLPLNTWIVVEQRSPGSRAKLVSKHLTQTEAEAERDRRNSGLAEPVFAAWIVLEPVAQHMGGRQAPTTA